MIAQCRYFMPFLSQKLNDDRFVMSIIIESAPKSNGTTSKYNNSSIYNSYLIEARKGDDGQDLWHSSSEEVGKFPKALRCII